MINIYCKTSSDIWDDEMPWGSDNPGPHELFNYLNTDLQNDPCMGKRIWILTVCMKFGSLEIDGNKIEWSFGESSVQNIKRFLDIGLKNGILEQTEYDELLKQSQYARDTFSCEYDIYKLVEDPNWKLDPKELQEHRMQQKGFFVSAIDQFQKLNPDKEIRVAGIN